MPRLPVILLSVFLFFQNAHAQSGVIELENPSFEGAPRCGTINGPMPDGWMDCGFAGESVPDVHPEEYGGSFQVDHPAQHGDTYLGMTVRDNDTWERVGQKLSSPMVAGTNYQFNIYLCRSLVYKFSNKKNGLAQLHRAVFFCIKTVSLSSTLPHRRSRSIRK